MKKIYTLIAITLLTVSTFAQSPEAFNYQAIVRDENGNALETQLTGFRISILKENIAVYVETHTPTTNAFGLVSIRIGNGTVVSGVFADIDWSAGAYFAKIEIDITGGTNYIDKGAHKLLSVPYALYAKTAGNVLTNAERSSITTALQTEAGPTFTASEANSITDAGSGKVITDNERSLLNTALQTLSVSLTGDTLFISSEDHIIIPGISDANRIITDARDSKTYKTVQIGEQIWMAENLAYLPSVSPSATGSETEPYYTILPTKLLKK